LPFCHIQLTGRKPLPSAYPRHLKTLGNHLRKRRLDLGLLQREMTDKLAVDAMTICNWETNRTSPKLSLIPRIIAFLGYIPYDTPSGTLGNRIVACRCAMDLSQKELARRLGVDPGTLRRCSSDSDRPIHTGTVAWVFLTQSDACNCYVASLIPGGSDPRRLYPRTYAVVPGPLRQGIRLSRSPEPTRRERHLVPCLVQPDTYYRASAVDAVGPVNLGNERFAICSACGTQTPRRLAPGQSWDALVIQNPSRSTRRTSDHAIPHSTDQDRHGR